MFGRKKKEQKPECVVKTIFEHTEHSISTSFDGYKTFNGKMTIMIETFVSIVVKEDENGKRWKEWKITQPNVLIDNPFYDCEFATNECLKAILAKQETDAKKWVANNYAPYYKIAEQQRMKLYTPW